MIVFDNTVDELWLADKLFDMRNINEGSLINYKGLDIKGPEQIQRFVEIIYVTGTKLQADKLKSDNIPILETREIKPESNADGLGGLGALFGGMGGMLPPEAMDKPKR